MQVDAPVASEDLRVFAVVTGANELVEPPAELGLVGGLVREPALEADEAGHAIVHRDAAAQIGGRSSSTSWMSSSPMRPA
jgi:hypothetical protein